MHTKASLQGAPYEPDSLPTFSVSNVSPRTCTTDLLTIGIFEDDLIIEGEKRSISNEDVKALDQDVGAVISELVENGAFTGKKGTSAAVRVGKAARWVALAGMGKLEGCGLQNWGPTPFQRAGETIATTAKANKCTSAAFCIPSSPRSLCTSAEAVAYGVMTGAYESTRFKSDAKPSPLTTVALLAGDDPEVEASVSRGEALARGNLFARWLVEAPPNVCKPAYLAGAAKALADANADTMLLTVLEKADCERLGMGCYLGVAECADSEPKFIHLKYSSGSPKRKLALIGKGVTFDAGGYNIKCGPGSMIELMKFDMGGAAAVLGAARTIAALAPPDTEVHFISAACENLISGAGLLPGDILVAASGKTVEIGNTDAEGRLTLADALWYAQEVVGAARCIDIATLTGAQIIALGTGIGAVMAPSSESAESVVEAGRGAGERWWRLPLEESYGEQLKSNAADILNVGGRAAGTITAGLFLQNFVDPEKMAWAHLDIAGPCWNDKAGGATGFGAATLAKWVESARH